ncbi:MAG: YtxH domain-containing protein [Anaerolineae bacterium]
MFGSLFRFIGGIIVGATVGAVTAALLAPKSGEQLKSDAQSYWEQIKQAGVDAEALRRAELETKFKKAKLNQPFELDANYDFGEKRFETKFKAGGQPQDDSTTGGV